MICTWGRRNGAAGRALHRHTRRGRWHLGHSGRRHLVVDDNDRAEADGGDDDDGSDSIMSLVATQRWIYQGEVMGMQSIW